MPIKLRGLMQAISASRSALTVTYQIMSGFGSSQALIFKGQVVQYMRLCNSKPGTPEIKAHSVCVCVMKGARCYMANEGPSTR